ncbi:Allergen Asp f 4 [Escovopsis weberi]|uniref:Allergen Asp f 4 n=1 Tax=Escovopsis weberi TaxID=150374 RepID=A0A0M8N832_ESCWE|nr:Allergen Asp f 4 [Escovopsis weberi]
MKFTSAAVLLAAAAGVSAAPSSNEARDFIMAKKPADAPAPAPAAPAYSSPAAGGGQGVGPTTYTPFCGRSKRATAVQIAYKGNVGGPGQYGCNIMPVSTSIAGQYQYSVTFTNKGGADQVCACWNKIGADGGINGFFKGNEAVNFPLPAGQSQAVVFDTNSQGGCACGVGSLALTAIGQFAGAWLEYDFGNLSNGGWSGADASCLVAAANKLPIPALSVCYSGKCSTIFEGGTGDNAYLGGMEALDGVGLNIPPGPAALTVTV